MIKGKQSLEFEQAPYLTFAASVAGKKEGEGPLGAPCRKFPVRWY